MTQVFRARLDAELAAADAAGLRRRLDRRESCQGAEIALDGQHLVNFTSNDYLGLAAAPAVQAAVRDALPRHGVGAGAAALLSGRSSVHAELEQALADYTGADQALLFTSGYLANLGTLPALIRRQDTVLHDRLNHASLLDAVIASRARHRRFAHLDTQQLATLLQQNTGDAQQFVVTESRYSMDGDLAPLPHYAALAAAADAVLYVDDAHGFGVTASGLGAAGDLNLSSNSTATHILMVTFGKALGAAGAAVLAPGSVIETLTQRARTFVYDTALPPVVVVAAHAALNEIRANPTLLNALEQNIKNFHAALRATNLPVPPVDGPIQPLLIGDPNAALTLAARLRDDGFYVRAVRPPTVPRGTARLRITLTAGHTPDQIKALVASLARHWPQ